MTDSPNQHRWIQTGGPKKLPDVVAQLSWHAGRGATVKGAGTSEARSELLERLTHDASFAEGRNAVPDPDGVTAVYVVRSDGSGQLEFHYDQGVDDHDQVLAAGAVHSMIASVQKMER